MEHFTKKIARLTAPNNYNYLHNVIFGTNLSMINYWGITL